MKELVISLLEENEKARVSTCQLVKEALKSLADNKLIDFATREKFSYTKADEDMVATVYIRLEECDEKFMGAFQTWFAYGVNGICREQEPGVYMFSSRMFSVCLSEIRELCCMLHRINSIKKNEDGFSGKVYLKISDFRPMAGSDIEDYEIEPLPKHAKYFNEFSELNFYDF